jgi:hypothetical protein
VDSDGAVSFTLRPNFDAPVPNDWVDYSVVGYAGGAQQTLQVFFPEDRYFIGEREFFSFVDAPALALRSYNCVTDIALTNGAGGYDLANKSFCMSRSGTIACPALGRHRKHLRDSEGVPDLPLGI